MGKIQERIVQLTHELPEKYQEEVLDFIEYIYTKAAWKSDTEYLSSVPGMKDKIIEASKTPLRECDTKLDW